MVRARDTAAIFAQAGGWPDAVECAALSPGGSPEDVLEALRRQGAKAECVAVVGHQPHLGRLLALSLRGDARAEAFELKKSAIGCVQFEGSPRAGQGVLKWLLSPRILRRLSPMNLVRPGRGFLARGAAFPGRASHTRPASTTKRNPDT